MSYSLLTLLRFPLVIFYKIRFCRVPTEPYPESLGVVMHPYTNSISRDRKKPPPLREHWSEQNGITFAA